MKFKTLIFVFFLTLCIISANAQVIDIENSEDDIQSAMIIADEIILEENENIIDYAPRISITAQTSHAFFAPSHLFSPDPRRAWLYSAIFPGLGQAYNRQFWKIPIVFGGFAGFTYAIMWNQGYFSDYQAAFVDIRSGNPEARRWTYFVPAGWDPDEFLEQRGREWFANVLEHRRDFYRHNRDLSVILTVAWYLLVMVDSYVDARLFNFTMSQDLSMRVAPTMISYRNNSPNNNILNSAHGLQWSFRF
jgi:hypothetical protein